MIPVILCCITAQLLRIRKCRIRSRGSVKIIPISLFLPVFDSYKEKRTDGPAPTYTHIYTPIQTHPDNKHLLYCVFTCRSSGLRNYALYGDLAEDTLKVIYIKSACFAKRSVFFVLVLVSVLSANSMCFCTSILFIHSLFPLVSSLLTTFTSICISFFSLLHFSTNSFSLPLSTDSVAYFTINQTAFIYLQ